MASTVEIIIKAVDKYSKDMKKAKTGLEKLAASTKLGMKVMEVSAKAASAAILGIGAAIAFLQRFGDAADRFGFTEAAKQAKMLETSVADAEAAFYKFNIGGREVQEWLGRASEAASYFIRIVGVLGSVTIAELQKINNQLHATTSGIKVMTLEWLKSQGIMNNSNAALFIAAVGADTYTQAIADADNALVELEKIENVTNFATVGLAASLESAATNATKQAQSIKALAKNHKSLNQILSQRRAIEDAIRAGDARALADARGGNGSGAREQGGPGGGRNMSVNVYIGNEKLKGQIRTTVSNDLMKPTTKGGGSGKK